MPPHRAHTACIGLAAALALGATGVTGVARAQTAAPAPAPAPAPATPEPEAAARVLTLAQVERVALEQQPQVLLARAATHVAEAQADVVRAPLLPQVTGAASYTRQTGNFAPRPGATPALSNQSAGGSLFSTSYDYWQFGLSATQLIYDFGATWKRLRSADLTVEAQRASEQVARLGVILAVRKAYFSARAAKELVAVAAETLADQKRHLAQVQGMVEVGIQPPIALAQQKAAQANATVQLIVAENNFATAKAQLNQAAGLTGGTDYDVADEALAPLEEEELPAEAVAKRALASRPEMLVLTRQREAQEATLSSARGGYGPVLSASAGVTDNGLALDQLVPNWNAGLLLTWPIFQGGLTTGQVRQAEAGLESVGAQRTAEELQVRLDVDTARLAVRAAKATIGAAEDALASAREQLRQAEQRYATGVGSILELTDAQVTYTSAAAQVVQARYSLSTARAQLLAAMGRTGRTT